MRHRWAFGGLVVSALAVALGAVVPGASASTADARNPSTVPILDIHPRTVRQGYFDAVTRDGSLLVATVPGTSAANGVVEEIEPRTGAVVRRSPTFAGIDAISGEGSARGADVVGDTIWISTTIASEGGSGADELVELSARTLRVLRMVRSSGLAGVAADSNVLWTMSGTEPCTFRRIDPANGAVVASFVARGACQGAMASSVDHRLFVFSSAGISAYDEFSGRRLVTVADEGTGGYFSATATPSRLVVNSSGLTIPGALIGYDDVTLRRAFDVTAPRGALCFTPETVPVAACSAGFADDAGGVLWAAGRSYFACLDPRSGSTLAGARRQVDFGTLTVIGDEAFAVTANNSLVRFSVPPVCRT